MNFLEAPCAFCGYNGPNYWQKGTHAVHCPWSNIGGAADRDAQMTQAFEHLPQLFNITLAITERHGMEEGDFGTEWGSRTLEGKFEAQLRWLGEALNASHRPLLESPDWSVRDFREYRAEHARVRPVMGCKLADGRSALHMSDLTPNSSYMIKVIPEDLGECISDVIVRTDDNGEVLSFQQTSDWNKFEGDKS